MALRKILTLRLESAKTRYFQSAPGITRQTDLLRRLGGLARLDHEVL